MGEGAGTPSGRASVTRHVSSTRTSAGPVSRHAPPSARPPSSPECVSPPASSTRTCVAPAYPPPRSDPPRPLLPTSHLLAKEAAPGASQETALPSRRGQTLPGSSVRGGNNRPVLELRADGEIRDSCSLCHNLGTTGTSSSELGSSLRKAE